MSVKRRHIPIETWLRTIGYPEYEELFEQNFTGVESLLYKSEADILDVGVTNPAHRARIVSSLVILRDKYEKGSRSSGIRRSSSSIHLASRLSFISSGPSSPISPGLRHSQTMSSIETYDSPPSNFPIEKVRADLEAELKLPNEDMRSHAWFHGSIPRQKAEKLIADHGDFIVRESISQPGDFVLTCNWRGVTMHFVINKNIPPNSKYARIQFHFETEMFESVPDLIRYYVGGARPITQASGAIIRSPVNRSLPLSYYDSKYAPVKSGLQRSFSNAYMAVNDMMPFGGQQTNLANRSSSTNNVLQGTKVGGYLAKQKMSHLKSSDHCSSSPDLRQQSVSRSQSNLGSQALGRRGSGSPHVTPQGTPPQARMVLHRRAGSQPVSMDETNAPNPNTNTGKFEMSVERHASLPVIDIGGINSNASISKLINPLANLTETLRAGSEPALSPIGEQQTPSSVHTGNMQATPSDSEQDLGKPPPKPSRIPSIKYQAKPKIKIRNIDLYEDDGHDYSDYSQVKADSSILENPQAVKYSFEISKKRKRSLVGQSSRSRPNVKVTQSGKVKESNASDSLKDAIRTLANISDTSLNDTEETESVVLRKTKRKSDQENNNNFKYTPTSSDDYDNNFRKVGVISLGEVLQDQDYDIPKSNEVLVDSSAKTSENKATHTQKRMPSDTRFSLLDTRDYGLLDEIPTHDSESSLPSITLPDTQPTTCFDLDKYVPKLLASDNKPLDSSTMVQVRTLLTQNKAKTLAQHLTKLDLELLHIAGDSTLGLAVTSGLELITLPHGYQLRRDILERYNCLAYFIALTILTGGGQPRDRALLISVWIETAQELKNTMGNLYSFSAIMQALSRPEITRLQSTWTALRTYHTKSAFFYDSKLKSFMKNIDEGTNGLPLQNVSIPHIIPLVQLLERTLEDVKEMTNWERADGDLGLDIMLIHLDTARLVTAQCGLYRVKGENVISNMEAEDKLLEIFETSFHMRLMWGWRGASVESNQRLNKFQQILSALSFKAETSNDLGTAL